MKQLKNKIGAYSQLVIKGVSNFDKVLEGHFNSLLDDLSLLDEDKKRVAEERLKICIGCPFNSLNASEKGFYDDPLNRDIHCTLCLCPIESKVKSFKSECAISLIEYNEEKNVGIRGYKKLWDKYEE